MGPSILTIISGLALLGAGAEALVRGSSAIALRMGVTPLAVGLTVVAIGTGSPELMVSVEAALSGSSAIALGNVLGSNISNIALILGLAALARPMEVRSQLIAREVPVMIGVTALLWLLIRDGALSRIDGLLLVLGSVAYIGFAYLASVKDRRDAAGEEFEEALPQHPISIPKNVILVAAGLLGLAFGAKLLVSGAVFVAGRLGVSEVVIGLTVIAIGTSLPELATSVMASIKGDADVAFGNVIGSNILNILLILGVAAVIRPFGMGGLKAVDLGAFIATAVLLLPLMRRGMILNRWEGGLLVAGYAAYIFATIS